VVRLAARAFPRLSGGEQARVSLARVLAQGTPAVLLDEPTAHLDVRHQELVLAVARDLATAGRAVVAVLHEHPITVIDHPFCDAPLPVSHPDSP